MGEGIFSQQSKDMCITMIVNTKKTIGAFSKSGMISQVVIEKEQMAINTRLNTLFLDEI